MTRHLALTWPSGMLTALSWALAAAGMVYWGLKLSTAPGPVEAAGPAAAPQAQAPSDAAAIARLLGGGAIPPSNAASLPATGRFILSGVVMGSRSAGIALLAVDGKPPRPFAVGSQVADGLVLQSVARRSASLGVSRDSPEQIVVDFAPQRGKKTP